MSECDFIRGCCYAAVFESYATCPPVIGESATVVCASGQPCPFPGPTHRLSWSTTQHSLSEYRNHRQEPLSPERDRSIATGFRAIETRLIDKVPRHKSIVDCHLLGTSEHASPTATASSVPRPCPAPVPLSSVRSARIFHIHALHSVLTVATSQMRSCIGCRNLDWSTECVFVHFF